VQNLIECGIAEEKVLVNGVEVCFRRARISVTITCYGMQAVLELILDMVPRPNGKFHCKRHAIVSRLLKTALFC